MGTCDHHGYELVTVLNGCTSKCLDTRLGFCFNIQKDGDTRNEVSTHPMVITNNFCVNADIG